MNKEILDYYASGIESVRLEKDPLEKVRTQEIILRYLDETPLKVLDVGGGAGVYSFWLKEKGHEVHLIDPSPVNISLAEKHGRELNAVLDSAATGVAQQLPFHDASFDIVLLLGPLYHLTERQERVKALAEACRVLKPGGKLFAATISRFASMLDGFSRNLVADPAFVSIMQQDLQNGQHRNPTDNFQYFTTAFFHHPNEIKQEMNDAGFDVQQILPVESFAMLLPAFDENWSNESFRELLLDTIRKIESDDSILGISAHHVTVAVAKHKSV
jgi:ubiquinone/menaquinone biosynthesis C-methylase UbiE